MNKVWLAFGYLLAANMQAGFLVFLAVGSGGFFDENYPLDFSWKLLLVPLSLLFAVYTYYKIILMVMALDKRKRGK